MLFLFAKVVFFQSSFADISVEGKSEMILKLDGDRPSRTVWQHHNRECNIIHNIFKSLLYMFRGVAVLPSREYSFIQFIQPNALAFNPVRRNWNSEQFIALIKPKTFCECCAWECLEKKCANTCDVCKRGVVAALSAISFSPMLWWHGFRLKSDTLPKRSWRWRGIHVCLV